MKMTKNMEKHCQLLEFKVEVLTFVQDMLFAITK